MSYNVENKTMEFKEILINILITALMLLIIISVTLLVLSQFNPFKECEKQNDSYIIKIGNGNLTCGELNTINTSIN
jgi:hypothetical protein